MLVFFVMIAGAFALTATILHICAFTLVVIGAFDKKAIAAFFGEHGVEPQRVREVWNSFAVQVGQAQPGHATCPHLPHPRRSFPGRRRDFPDQHVHDRIG